MSLPVSRRDACALKTPRTHVSTLKEDGVAIATSLATREVQWLVHVADEVDQEAQRLRAA